MIRKNSQKALFLDRDGTLIQDAHYLKDPDKVEAIPGAGKVLKEVKKAGYHLFMHTNQSGIARGYYDWSDVHACNIKMHQDFGWPDNFFSEVCIAPESPTETGGYRKPSPRFEQEMTQKYELDPSQCWVIGDKWIDAQTGLDAGMGACLVRTGKSIDEPLYRLAEQNKVPVFQDIKEFVRQRVLISE
ncbi:MAG: HAD-IIIA family hydrolase [Opitutales bacterium]|nr:HAD-IIIA family hydrolase [Opitutales bacterium]